jgi:hypothetical protein
MKRLMMLGGLALVMSSPSLAHAELFDDSTQTAESKLSPTDYGAGYKVVIFHQHQEHAPGPGDDQYKQGPIELNTTFPLIASPTSSEAKAFNSNMKKMAAKWWGWPLENTTESDPDGDSTNDCEPVGLSLPPDVDASEPSGLKMLPGVISTACESYGYLLGAAHGGGSYWGFNWLMNQRREVRASDIFDMKTNWLRALTDAANADRSPGASGTIEPLDFSDISHWVVTSKGLGLTYPDGYFEGFEEGGDGMFDVIPWSKLVPNLRKDGIVPLTDR